MGFTFSWERKKKVGLFIPNFNIRLAISHIETIFECGLFISSPCASIMGIRINNLYPNLNRLIPCTIQTHLTRI